MAEQNGGVPRVPGPRRFVIAPQHRVRQYAPEVREILTAVGHPEALVTDGSSLSDFFDAFDAEDPEAVLALATLAALVGTSVNPDDLIADLAERLHRRRSGSGP
jgi:hypothetical protein